MNAASPARPADELPARGARRCCPGRGRARVGQAWRAIHAALHHAAEATGCARYAACGTLRARRGDIGGDLDARRCLERGGFLPGAAAVRHARLHAEFAALMRPAGEADRPDMEAFIAAVQELETHIWALVPVERLPVGMFASVDVGQPGRLRLARRSRRAGDLVL
jgi:hypothetical protein